METINKEKYIDDLKKKKTSTPNSERAYWVDLTANLIGRPFKQVVGLTALWPLGWIKDAYGEAFRATNPGKVWWGIRKRTKNVTVPQK